MSASPSIPPGSPAPASDPSPRPRMSAGAGLLIILICLGGAAFAGYRFMQTNSTAEFQPITRWYVCSETLKPFEYTLNTGDKSYPVMSPFSHKLTGYPAEICYCGTGHSKHPVAQYVLLNTYVGKPEPTHCPKCGAIVIPHNPINSPAGAAASSAASQSAGASTQE